MANVDWHGRHFEAHVDWHGGHFMAHVDWHGDHFVAYVIVTTHVNFYNFDVMFRLIMF